VLVTGEPGSGRETLARYLHSQSMRRERPFVEVSVSSIVKANAAQELFGHEAGGRIHYGRLEQAMGGTLFLDEVADMDMEAQAQLVGALDTGSFLRVGGNEPVSVDVRIIAATTHNLEEVVQQGHFREDLFYHLNVVPLHVPPLREHAEDVPDLLNFYVDWFVTHEKLPYRHFNVGAQNVLRNHPWLGNVRELKNLVQRLLILGAGPEITPEEVEAALGAPDLRASGGLESMISFDQPLRQAREDFEKLYLEYQLQQHEGNISRMAKVVGMERTHLYRKLKSLAIEFKDKR
jgi:DNA-binding NtrC family response regulator